MATLFEQAKASYKAKHPDIQSAWLDSFDENVARKLAVDVFKADTPAVSITIPVTTTSHISAETCKRLIERWNTRNGGFNITITHGTSSLLYVTLSGWAVEWVELTLIVER
jgi:hypothetical protein